MMSAPKNVKKIDVGEIISESNMNRISLAHSVINENDEEMDQLDTPYNQSN